MEKQRENEMESGVIGVGGMGMPICFLLAMSILLPSITGLSFKPSENYLPSWFSTE